MKKLLVLSRYIGLSLIFILASLLLWNCESSDEEFTLPELQHQNSLEYLSLDQFKDQIESAELLQALEPNFKLVNHAFHYKNEKIEILTDQILKYTKSGITTYTFRLSKNTSKSSDFENLLVHIKKDDSYQLALTKFKYKKASSRLPYSIIYKKINENKLSNIGVLNDLLAKQYVDGILLDDCVDVSYTCPYGGTTYHTSDQCGPDGSGPGSTTILNFDPCFQDSRSDRGDNTDNDNSDTGEGTDDRDGGGTGTGTGSGGVLEPPCGDSIHGCDKIEISINNALDDGDSFVHPSTFNKEDLLKFESIQKFKEYQLEFEKSFSISSFNLKNEQDGTVVTRFKGEFNTAIPVYLNIHAKSILDNPNTQENEFSLKEVTSFESGFTPFLDWKQNSFEHSINNDISTIKIYGHFNIGISIDSFDISYSDSYIVTISLNNKTGKAIDFTVKNEK